MSINSYQRFLAVSVILAAFTTAAQAQSWPPKRPSDYGPKRTVSISKFDVKIPQTVPTGSSISGGLGSFGASSTQSIGTISVPNIMEFGTGLTDVATTILTESTGFSIIETSQPAVAADGTTAPADEPTVAAQYHLTATITDISCRQRTGGVSIGIFNAGQGRYENRVVVDVRLVDPRTNVVVESVKATGSKTSKGSIFGLEKYEGGSSWDPGTKVLDLTYKDFESSSLGEACRLAVQDAAIKLMAKLVKRPWEADVLKLVQDGDTYDVYLNLPADCGLTVGDRLELCIPGEDLKDPKTGRVVGKTKAKVLGTMLVSSLANDTVLCTVSKQVVSENDLTQPLIARLLRS